MDGCVGHTAKWMYLLSPNCMVQNA
jgi:hypothetical protein